MYSRPLCKRWLMLSTDAGKKHWEHVSGRSRRCWVLQGRWCPFDQDVMVTEWQGKGKKTFLWGAARSLEVQIPGAGPSWTRSPTHPAHNALAYLEKRNITIQSCSKEVLNELLPVSQRQGPSAQLQRIRWDHLMDCQQQSHQNIHTLDVRKYSFHHRCRLHHPSASIS